VLWSSAEGSAASPRTMSASLILTSLVSHRATAVWDIHRLLSQGHQVFSSGGLAPGAGGGGGLSPAGRPPSSLFLAKPRATHRANSLPAVSISAALTRSSVTTTWRRPRVGIRSGSRGFGLDDRPGLGGQGDPDLSRFIAAVSRVGGFCPSLALCAENSPRKCPFIAVDSGTERTAQTPAGASSGPRSPFAPWAALPAARAARGKGRSHPRRSQSGRRVGSGGNN
jgi:hypothetical protein